MIIRRDSLEAALADVESRRQSGTAVIVVSRGWWCDLSVGEQESYRRRAEQAVVELRTDEMISSHYVELRSRDDGPPLSTEQPM